MLLSVKYYLLVGHQKNMKERIIQPKKTIADSFSIPSLKQPTRGFGSQSSGASSSASPNNSLFHDISQIPLRPPQAKLTINQPGDIYEQQADTVAQEVVGRLGQLGNHASIQHQQMPQEEELQMSSMVQQHPATETLSTSVGDRVIQRAKLNIRKDGTISGVSKFRSRPTSNIRGSQGQHLTAYVVFEDMIVNRVTDRTVGEAAAELVKVLEEISELPGMKLKSAEYLELPLMTNIELLKGDDITAQGIGIVIDNILSIRNKVPGTAERGTGGGHGEAEHSGIIQEVEKALRTNKWKESWNEDIVSNQVRYRVWRLLDYDPTNPTSQEDKITIANKIVTHYKSIMSAYPLTNKWLNEREDYFQTYLEGHRDDIEMPLKQLDSSNLEEVFNLVASEL